MKTILIVLFFIGMFIYNVFKSTAAAKKKQSERVSSLGETEHDEMVEGESKLVHNQGVGRNDFASRNPFDPALEGVSSLENESHNRATSFSHRGVEYSSKEAAADRDVGQDKGVAMHTSAGFDVFDREEVRGFDAERVFKLRDAVVFSAILHRPQY